MMSCLSREKEAAILSFQRALRKRSPFGCDMDTKGVSFARRICRCVEEEALAVLRFYVFGYGLKVYPCNERTLHTT